MCRPEITQPFSIVLGYGEQVSLEISRGEFETLLEPFILRIKSVLQETLTILIENTDGEINVGALDEVILVGGSTRIPAIRIYSRIPLDTSQPRMFVKIK